MKLRMFCSFLLLLIVGINSSFGCSCNFLDEDFSMYDFISLVEIKSISMESRTLGIAHVNTIRHYKGTKSRRVVLYAIGTSCDMFVKEGEQWLMFGYKGKKNPETNSCTHSMRYKRVNGERDLKSVKKDRIHYLVDSTFANIKLDVNRKVECFENGDLELVEEWAIGRKNGHRIAYYNNGKIKLFEEYSDGKLNGKRVHWYKNGKLEREGSYIKGIQIGTHLFYWRGIH